MSSVPTESSSAKSSRSQATSPGRPSAAAPWRSRVGRAAASRATARRSGRASPPAPPAAALVRAAAACAAPHRPARSSVRVGRCRSARSAPSSARHPRARWRSRRSSETRSQGHPQLVAQATRRPGHRLPTRVRRRETVRLPAPRPRASSPGTASSEREFLLTAVLTQTTHSLKGVKNPVPAPIPNFSTAFTPSRPMPPHAARLLGGRELRRRTLLAIMARIRAWLRKLLGTGS